MRIGIIGTGNMGRSLGLGWSRKGHEVLFGSRDLDKARSVAANGSRSAKAGNFDEAAVFGEIVLYTARDPLLPSKLLKDPRTLSGKIVIDCNNSAIFGLDTADPDNRRGLHFPSPIPSLAERLADDVPDARIVKAFNTIPHVVIELGPEKLAEQPISVFLCSDDAQAKAVVSRLVEDIGFVGVDSGSLERAQLVEGLADFIRWQIIGMNLGPFATVSLRLIPQS